MSISRILQKIKGAEFQELFFRGKRFLNIMQDRVRPAYAISSCIENPSEDDIADYKKAWDGKENFYFSNSDRAFILDILARDFPWYLPKILRKADDICAMKIPLFEKNVVFGKVINWHANPVTSEEWPREHWSKIKVVNEGSSSDAKWVWELNRHQFLLPVAIAYFATRQEKYAAFIVGLLDDWIAENSPGQGINWVESQELSFRVVIWAWVLELVRGCEQLSANRLNTYLDSIVQQAEHIYRYPSFYISPNTHLLGEAFALFFIGCIYPEITQSCKWKKFGQKVLEEEIDNQVGEDGVHRELSTYYHCYAVDYFLHYLLLAETFGVKISDNLRQKVTKMVVFLEHITRPDGTLPMFGDGDGGSLLPLSEDNYKSVRSLLNRGLLVTNAPSFKPLKEDKYVDEVWLFGRQFEESEQYLNKGIEQKKTAFFPDANILAHRFGKRGKHQLLFNAGKMGFLSAGHSHADYFHIELCYDNAPFLVDPGTYSYKDPSWRNITRSTSSHNTVTVDGQDQVIGRGSFGWQQIPEASKISSCNIGDILQVRACHGCYPETEHERTILVAFGGIMFLSDRLLAEGEHKYCTFYHLDPSVEVIEKTDGVFFLKHSSGPTVELIKVNYDDKSSTLHTGNSRIKSGWHFPRYGSREKTLVVESEAIASDSYITHTMVVPQKQTQGLASNIDRIFCERTEAYDEVTVELSDKRIVYRYSCFGKDLIHSKYYESFSRQAVEIQEEGHISELILVGATLLKWGGKTIFSNDIPESLLIVRVRPQYLQISTPHFEKEIKI